MASSIARPIFDRALNKFKARLTLKQRDKFQVATLNDLKRAVLDIQQTQRAKSKAMNLPRILKFVEAMASFGQVIETFLNCSEMVAFIWGPMKFVLQIAGNFADAFELLLNAYQRIGEALPLTEAYSDLFQGQAHFDEACAAIYEDILEFHLKALRIFESPTWYRVFRSAWKDFESTFNNTLADILDHRKLIESHATVIEYIQARAGREDARVKLTQLLDAASEQQHQAVLRWLLNDGCSAEHRRICEDRASGAARALGVEASESQASQQAQLQSGRWILSHASYLPWRYERLPNLPTLWLNGIPGAGKTVLASAIIENCKEDKASHCAYFYCKDGDVHRSTCIGILRGLIRQLYVSRWNQLASEDRGLLRFCYDRCLSSGQLNLEDDKLATEILTDLLDPSSRTYIVIDGLDECSLAERKRIFKCLESLQPCQDDGSLRLLIVSQIDSDIRYRLNDFAEISLQQADTVSDIVAFVDDACCLLAKKFDLPPEDTAYIQTAVMHHVNGMFLYARLVMSDLYCQATSEGVRECLNPETFPSGLNEVYDRIMRRVNREWHEKEAAMALRVLAWLTYAKRPIKWREIQGALSIDVDSRTCDLQSRQMRTHIRVICGVLLKPIADDQLELVHRTAKQYLKQCALMQPHIQEWNMAALCLQYLTFECFDADIAYESLRRSLIAGYYAFADYAVTHWAEHFWAAVYPEQNHQIEKAAAALADTSEYGTSVDEFTAYHDILEPAKSTDTPGDPHGCMMWKVSSSYQQICSLVDYIRRRKSLGFIAQDEIAPRTLQYSITGLRQVLEELGSCETTNAIADETLRALYGSHWFKCPKATCFYFHEGFTDAKTRDTHVVRHEKPFRCDCSPGELFSFATKKELDKHMLVFHPQTGRFAVTFARINKSQKRIKVKDEKASSSKAKHPHKFACSFPNCPSKFTRNASLKNHERTHSNEKPYVCAVDSSCKKAFVRHNDLVRHRQSVHRQGGKQHACHGPLQVYFSNSEGKTWGCGKVFPRADHLAAHLRTEAGKKCIQPLYDEKKLLLEWQKRPAEDDFEVDEDFINSIINYHADHDPLEASSELAKSEMFGCDENLLPRSSSQSTFSGSSPL